MFLQKFASERNVKADTVSAYIREHEDEFDGLTEMRGKKKWLFPGAIELLDEKYPKPQLVQVVDNPKLVKRLIEQSELIEKLNAELLEVKASIFEEKELRLEAENKLKLITTTADQKLNAAVTAAKEEVINEMSQKHQKELNKKDDEIKALLNRSLVERIANKIPGGQDENI